MTRIQNSGSKPSPATIKFLYSYNGRILPCQIDDNLRYVGGHTRVLAVDRSVSYAELIVKLCESCGFPVNLKCKPPTKDLDVLVSVTSDEDLAAVVEEYGRVSPDAKIRAVLFPALKTISPVPSVASLVDYSAAKPPQYSGLANGRQQCPAVDSSAYKFRRFPVAGSCRASSPIAPRFCKQRNPRHNYFVPQWNFIQ